MTLSRIGMMIHSIQKRRTLVPRLRVRSAGLVDTYLLHGICMPSARDVGTVMRPFPAWFARRCLALGGRHWMPTGNTVAVVIQLLLLDVTPRRAAVTLDAIALVGVHHLDDSHTPAKSGRVVARDHG